MDALEYVKANLDRIAMDHRKYGDHINIYIHRKFPDLQFYEVYKHDYQVNTGAKNWLNEGFVLHGTYNLHDVRRRIDPTYRPQRRRMTRRA